jgi:hypothetical protein
MGTVPEALEIHRPVPDKRSSPALLRGVPLEWAQLCRIWFDRSTAAKRSRSKSYYFLRNVGRWNGHVHPAVLSPADWTRDLAAELISVVCQWHGGDWCSIDPVHIKSRGKVLAPETRADRICSLRIFFRDLQEWELIPRRFDPMRHLRRPCADSPGPQRPSTQLTSIPKPAERPCPHLQAPVRQPCAPRSPSGKPHCPDRQSPPRPQVLRSSAWPSQHSLQVGESMARSMPARLSLLATGHALRRLKLTRQEQAAERCHRFSS